MMISANSINIDCNACMFKSECVFDLLNTVARKKWNKIKKSFHCQNETVIFNEEDHPENIFIVCKGRIKMHTTDSNGQQIIAGIKHPGKIFGLTPLFSTKNDYLGGCKCMGDTEVSSIDKKKLDVFLKSYPKLYRIFIARISDDIYTMQLDHKNTAYKSAKVKIANILLKCISFKSKKSETPEVHGIKRIEIAEITGLALETVVRTLCNMEKDRIIKRESKCIKIINLQKLKKTASINL